MATDKPTVHLSLAQLRKEVVKPDPFRISLSGSRIITFPDINAMESEESDILLEKLESPKGRTWELLNDWLSQKDAEVLRAEKLSRAELTRLIDAATKYYKDTYGDQGEDTASAS